MKKTFILATLIIFIFTCAASGQTRKKTTTIRRGKSKIVRTTRIARTKVSVPKRKPMNTTSTSIATTTASGLSYIITERGSGEQAAAGKTVTVHYTGLLTSGAKFDSSLDRNEPISFPLGMGRVIKGWDEGIAKLRVGDKAMLIIPPALGYGAKGAGNGEIPPNATLIFIVELVGVK
ncbi:MAG: FKBP-type peptidyl-prolyl cis-trans isomerase [Pyrinomonadaceae bacterium]|jgi:FKBP-type peptidyl-prolyl cis-trans isomerase